MIGLSSAAKYVLPGRLSVCVDEDAEDGDSAPARGPRRRAEAITPLPRAPNRRVRSGPPWGMTSEIFFPAPLGDLHASARTCTIASFALCPARLATNEENDGKLAARKFWTQNPGPGQQRRGELGRCRTAR